MCQKKHLRSVWAAANWLRRRVTSWLRYCMLWERLPAKSPSCGTSRGDDGHDMGSSSFSCSNLKTHLLCNVHVQHLLSWPLMKQAKAVNLERWSTCEGHNNNGVTISRVKIGRFYYMCSHTFEHISSNGALGSTMHTKQCYWPLRFVRFCNW